MASTIQQSLPLHVCPYASTHPWHPCSTESSTGAPTVAYTCEEEEERENLYFGWRTCESTMPLGILCRGMREHNAIRLGVGKRRAASDWWRNERAHNAGCLPPAAWSPAPARGPG